MTDQNNDQVSPSYLQNMRSSEETELPSHGNDERGDSSQRDQQSYSADPIEKEASNGAVSEGFSRSVAALGLDQTSASPGGHDEDPRASSPEPKEFPTIEGYLITEQVGQGGAGIVYRASQLSTHRTVAVKVLRGVDVTSRNTRARFEREVELAALLEHPNIARVYDSGLHLDHYFYAMEYVSGWPLDTYVDQHRATPQELADLMQKICTAIQYAHNRGVVHRDLKPSNIFVDETASPRILDFGLAKDHRQTHSEAELSIVGSVMGTPYYMSPEQASGFHDKIDQRTDVYSLGVVLYRLLCGEVPFRGSLHAVMNQVLNDEPLRPNKLATGISPDLEAICLKAMAKEPARRYQSAREMAEDFQRFLNGDPVSANTSSTFGALTRWCRHPKRIAQCGIATIFASVFAIVFHATVLITNMIGSTFDSARYADVDITNMTALMLGYLLLLDTPCFLLGVQILKMRRFAIMGALLITAPLFLFALAVSISPAIYPIEGVHRSTTELEAVWVLFAVISLVLLVMDLMALCAFQSNRQLIEWQLADRRRDPEMQKT